MAQAFGVVYVLVSGEAAEDGLPQHAHKSVAAILACTCIGDHLARHRGQAKHVVEFPVRQQSGVGSDNRAVKLEHQAAVKIEPENLAVGFTPLGSP
jgi:hypothetical protein